MNMVSSARRWQAEMRTIQIANGYQQQAELCTSDGDGRDCVKHSRQQARGADEGDDLQISAVDQAKVSTQAVLNTLHRKS